MVNLKGISKAFKPAKIPKATPLGDAGYDNARENIDPHVKTKVVNLKEFVQNGVSYDFSVLLPDHPHQDVTTTAKVRFDGGIGIGVDNPAAGTFRILGNSTTALVVANAADAPLLLCDTNNFVVTIAGDGIVTGSITVDGNTLVVDKVNNRVGIGMTAPEFRFHAKGTSFPVIMAERTTTVEDDRILSAMGVGLSTSLNMVNGFGTAFVIRVKDNADTWNSLASIGGFRDGGDGEGAFFISLAQGGLLSGNEVLVIKNNGNLGIGTTTPTTQFSVNEKSGMSAIGGHCIKLTNQTGANSVQGEVVRTDAGNDDAVILALTGEVNAIGVFLDAGVADGAEAWIVVSGIADVKADTAGFTRGDRLVTSLAAATVGRATTNNAPAVAVHFQEIGHAIETAAANALGRAVLHFN